MPATLPEVAAAVLDLLEDGCVWDEDEMVDALEERGVDLGPDPEDTVVDVLESDSLPLVFPVGGSGYALLPALLRGRTLTHRLTEVEVEYDALALGADLSPLWVLTDSEVYRRLVDGTELVPAMQGFDDDLLVERDLPTELPDDFMWLLARGTLERLGVAAGEMVGVTVRDDGFELSSMVDSPGAAESAAQLGERLADGLGQRGEDEPDEIDDLVWLACADDPEFLVKPEPPLSEALNAAGLARHGDFVAPPGFDFGRWRTGKRVARISSLHSIDEDEALAVLAFSQMYDDDTRGEHAQLVRDLMGLLDDPLVMQAVLAETIGAGRAGAAALGLFAETLEPQVSRAHRASLRWLRGKALERLGRVLEAEEAFEAALDLDGDHLLSLYDAARYASDRGDAERGLSLLRRAGAPSEDGLVGLLTHFRPVERADLGRNEPCWCGSGRKYKVCHRNRETLPLADRAAWLYQKAGTYLSDGPWRERLVEVAEIRARHWDDAGAVWSALDEGLVGDLVLFEGGAFEEFLAERGVLLPDDERLLAEQWLLVERSVHEIEAVSPGAGFTARDVRTGDRVDVRESTASRHLTAGELICARLVPAGDSVQLFGGYEVVTLRERDQLIALLDGEPEPEELIAVLSGRFAPPQLQNTEGDPLVFCEATLRSQDPDGLAAQLDAAYDRLEGETRWVEHVTTHGMERIRATLELDGADLHVEVNSEARLDRVLATVRELQPDLTLTAETRRPADDVQEVMSRAPFSGSGSVLDPQDPAVAAALAEFVRAQEQAWLDEPIPALDGATPREAAADPTRRPDLLRLLDTYDVPTGAGVVGMDPARLRSALGLA